LGFNSSGTLKSMETAAAVSRRTSFIISFKNEGMGYFFLQK